MIKVHGCKYILIFLTNPRKYFKIDLKRPNIELFYKRIPLLIISLFIDIYN